MPHPEGESAFQLFQRVRAPSPRRRLLVCDVVFEGSLPRDPDSVPVARFGAFMTSLITVGYALRFALADAAADLEYTERNLCEDVKGTDGPDSFRYRIANFVHGHHSKS